jgi:tetratricopeptide (TPR) repeat protein
MSRTTQSLFPHQKLDWTISRLEERVERAPDDPALLLELARAILSRGLYHGGGERDCSQALAMTRKALSDDPSNVEGLVTAGLCLIGMDRGMGAHRYLDQAMGIDAERADLRLALGKLEQLNHEHGNAVKQLEMACRISPELWEAHLELGRALMLLARQQGHPRRLVERAQYHLVQALKRDPGTEQSTLLLKDLGVSCMLTARYREAEKFFTRLRDHERYKHTATYHLGLVAYELGKYKNAIQHFRQFLRDKPDDAAVLARMAMAWFQLGEHSRAREACHQALMADPDNVEARYALGCTLLEEGSPAEAMKVFREALRDAPDHMPSYVEMVRARRQGGDPRWLISALHAEVANYDKLAPGGGQARQTTRKRVRTVLDELRSIGPSQTGAILGAIDHTQSEALRFELWEAACGLATSAVADGASQRLREPGRFYGPGLGGVAVAAATAVPEQYLVDGLKLEEADLKRAAVERHPAAHDVQQHRRNLSNERDRARSYQALLLLSIALRRSGAGRTLLKKWASTADAEMAVAASVGLALYGDAEASHALLERAKARQATPLVDRLLQAVSPAPSRREPRKVDALEQTACRTCGRKHEDVTHMIAGGDAVICDRCVVHITQHRASLTAPDEATCALCGRSHFESAGLFRYNGVDICNQCVQLSLGLLEREEIDQFLEAW